MSEHGKDIARQAVEEKYRGKNYPQVLHKSDNFLCINKCYDIKINSDDRTEMTTEHQLRSLYPELVDAKCKHAFRFVHRLDFATSGAICLGLNKTAARHLDMQFKQKNVVKYYLALVRGHVKDDSLFIDVATGDLDDDSWTGRRCAMDHQSCIGPKNTQTLLVCLERGTYDEKPVSKVLLRPFTGRQHQLRVHCDYIGHTIVGDYTYSLRADTSPDRMMLHSHRLMADTGLEKLDITAPDPFVPNLDSRWCPCDVCHSYIKAVEIAESFNVDSNTIRSVTLRAEET